MKKIPKLLKFPRLSKFIFYSIIFYIVIMLLHDVFGLNEYIMQIINLSLVYVILTVSLNLINGFTGQFSIGHMGFAAVGAYISAILTTLVFKVAPKTVNGYVVFIFAMIIGGIAAALIGFLIGIPTLRLRGDYLAIVTLGFGEIIRVIINNIDYVGGPRGLLGIPKFSNFTVIFIVTIITIIIIRNIVYSTYGRSLLSIREDSIASELVGVDTTRYKVLAFVVGSFFAGVAGSLLCHLIQIAHPTQFGFIGSISILIMVYAGGMGSITGSIVAAFALTFLSEGLRIVLENFGAPIEWRMVIYAVLLIVIMLFRPEGLMGGKEWKLLVPEGEKE